MNQEIVTTRSIDAHTTPLEAEALPFEILSADRATGKQQEEVGRFDNQDLAVTEMQQRQACEPARAFYCFLRVSARVRIIVSHTL